MSVCLIIADYHRNFCSNKNCKRELADGQPIFVVCLAVGDQKGTFPCCSERCKDEVEKMVEDLHGKGKTIVDR